VGRGGTNKCSCFIVQVINVPQQQKEIDHENTMMDERRYFLNYVSVQLKQNS
jgi:hypothetical protein